MKTSKLFLVLIFLTLILLNACKYAEVNSDIEKPGAYKTKSVVIIIMDGARYSETFGDSTLQYIPNLATQIAPQAVLCENFYNDGPTYTVAGHAAITTGYFQPINNSGFEWPSHPSICQYYNKVQNVKGPLTYIITSKDKLAILGNTSNPSWHNKYLPSTDCGINGGGLGSGYRSDSLTCLEAISILSTYHPRIVIINFKEPDESGHTGVWDAYVNGIRKTDEYISKIWTFLNNDKFYKDSTTVFITNDHGRHLDGVNGGFSNHGCDCEGCKHIFLLAAGPDFKKNKVIDRHYSLIDIAPTTAKLLGFPFPPDSATVMQELFIKYEDSDIQAPADR